MFIHTKISQTVAKTKSFRASASRAKNMAAAVTIASLSDKRSFATNNDNNTKKVG